MNHISVEHDITRSDGPPVTQRSLKRLPGQKSEVDAALYETARRLFGRLPGEPRRRPVRPTTPEQAATWAATATYLSARLQSTTAEVADTPGHEGRAPDMSPAAAAAMRAVLAEMAQDKVAAPYGTQLKKAVFKPFAASGGAIRVPSQVGQVV